MTINNLDNFFMSPAWKKVQNPYETLVDQWDIVDTGIGVFNNILEISTLIFKNSFSDETAYTIKRTITHLELLYVINIPIKLANVCKKTFIIFKRIHFKDYEGAAITTFSLSLSIGFLIESLASKANTIRDIFALQHVYRYFSTGLSFSTAIMTADLLIDAHQFHTTSKFHSRFKKMVLNELEDGKSQNIDKINRLVTSFLKIKDLSELNQKPQLNLLERKATSEVKGIFKKLSEELREGKALKADAIKHLKEIDHLLKEERKSQAFYLTTYSVKCVAMGLMFYPVPYLIPLSLFTAAAISNLGKMVL